MPVPFAHLPLARTWPVPDGWDLLAPLRRVPSPAVLPPDATSPRRPARPRDHQHRLCPDCTVVLTPLEDQGIVVDECPSCHGVWLDPGELDLLVVDAQLEDRRRRRLDGTCPA